MQKGDALASLPVSWPPPHTQHNVRTACQHNRIPNGSVAALPPSDEQTQLLKSVPAQTSLLIEIQRDPEAQILAVRSAKSTSVGSLILIRHLIDVIGDYSQNVSKQQLNEHSSLFSPSSDLLP